MNVVKIRVGLSQTINIGNFENVRPSVEVEDDPQFKIKTKTISSLGEKEVETTEECYERLSKLCHKLLYKEIIKLEQQTQNNK